MIDMIEPTPETTEQPAAFLIDSDERAEWLLRKLANLEAEKNRVQAQAEQILKQLESDAERLRFLFGAQLEEYCRRKLQASGNRRRSIHFLQGSCCFRTVPASVKVTDSNAALCYAEENLPEAMQTVTLLNGQEYRRAAEERYQQRGETL